VAKAHKRPPRVSRKVVDPIPVEPLRERVLQVMEERELTWKDLATWCGWVDEHGRVDTTRLQRRLGLKAESRYRKRGKTKLNGELYGGTKTEFISYPIAAAICKAVGIEPVEVRDPVTGEPIL
jgi:hypothetical protein